MDEFITDLRAKGFKGFLSIAQLRRCDSLVEQGTIKKEIFERDLLATDIDATPWRKGQAKEEDGSEEFQAGYRAAMIARRKVIAAEVSAQSQQVQDPQAGSADLIAAGLVVFVLVVILGVGYIFNAYQCHSKADKMGFGSTYGPIEGCMIKTKTGWIDIEKYRYMGD